MYVTRTAQARVDSLILVPTHERIFPMQVANAGEGSKTGSGEDPHRSWRRFQDDGAPSGSERHGGDDGNARTGAPPQGIDFVIEPGRVLRILLIIIAGLVIASTATQAMRLHVPDFPLRDSIAHLFYVDFEQSVPTLYSSVVLIISALLFGVVGHAHRRADRSYIRHWSALSILFLLLAVDESAVLHEQATGPFRRMLNIESGPLWWAWVIPAALAVAVLAVGFLRFFNYLPRPTRRRLIAAAILFLGGAIGIELVGAAYASVHGVRDFTYVLIATAEESLEMLGGAVLVYALLAYIPAGLPVNAWRLRVVQLD